MSNKHLVVCVFFYNRPELVKGCLDALSASVGPLLVSIRVFVDGPKNSTDSVSVQQVRDELVGYHDGGAPFEACAPHGGHGGHREAAFSAQQ